MRAAYDAEQIRAAEQPLLDRLPDGTLMARASTALARRCAALLGRVVGARVVVLAGAGNNGGDALYAGAALARRGAGVEALLVAERVHEPGLAALRAAGGRVRRVAPPAAANPADSADSPDSPEDHGHPSGISGIPAMILGRLAAADLVIDGMLGIGGRGGLRGVHAEVAESLGRLRETRGGPTAGSAEGPTADSAEGPDAGSADGSTGDSAGGPTALRSADGPAGGGPIVVAVDVPSGVDASTGEVAGPAVRADVTVTFGGLKTGLVVAPGAAHAGTVEVVDIGLDLPVPGVTLLDADDVAGLLPVLPAETDKYRRGVVGVVAGSDTYTGAAVLAVAGALAGGAGMVRYAGTAHPAELVRHRWPEAVVTVVDRGDGDAVVGAGRVQAWVVGSGLGTDDDAASIVRAVLRAGVPVVADADAITVLAEHPDWLRDRTAPTLLTPHAGEFARLVGADRDEIEARRLEHVRRAAADLRATILLKGSTTLVAHPGGDARVNTAETPYLATAGSGDVLSGVCGALLAAGLEPLDAGSAGAFLHGLAGLLAAGRPAAPFTAMQIAEHVPAAIRTVRA